MTETLELSLTDCRAHMMKMLQQAIKKVLKTNEK